MLLNLIFYFHLNIFVVYRSLQLLKSAFAF